VGIGGTGLEITVSLRKSKITASLFWQFPLTIAAKFMIASLFTGIAGLPHYKILE
jgi:hypothetical protein